MFEALGTFFSYTRSVPVSEGRLPSPHAKKKKKKSPLAQPVSEAVPPTNLPLEFAWASPPAQGWASHPYLCFLPKQNSSIPGCSQPWRQGHGHQVIDSLDLPWSLGMRMTFSTSKSWKTTRVVTSCGQRSFHPSTSWWTTTGRLPSPNRSRSFWGTGPGRNRYAAGPRRPQSRDSGHLGSNTNHQDHASDGQVPAYSERQRSQFKS